MQQSQFPFSSRDTQIRINTHTYTYGDYECSHTQDTRAGGVMPSASDCVLAGALVLVMVLASQPFAQYGNDHSHRVTLCLRLLPLRLRDGGPRPGPGPARTSSTPGPPLAGPPLADSDTDLLLLVAFLAVHCGSVKTKAMAGTKKNTKLEGLTKGHDEC